MTQPGQVPRPLLRWSAHARGLRLAVAALAGVVVLVLALQPWWLAAVVSHRLSASSGRAVRIDSMWITLSSSFAPVAQLRGIRIDNAPWADAQKPFAALAAATAIFSWRSIEERRPVIALIVLRDGEVDLEQRNDGLRNWRLTQPDSRGPGRVKVLAIRGEHATIRFLHGPFDLDVEARAMPNREADGGAPASEAMPTRIDAHGTWHGVPFVVGAATAEAVTLVETGHSFRVRGRAEAGGARVDLDGRIGDIVRWPRVEAHVVAAAPALRRIVEMFGAHAGAADKPLRVEGTLHGDATGYALSALHGRLGATDLAGDVRWARGEQRDLLRAALTSESTDLADLRSIAGRMPATTKAAASGTSAAASAAAGSASAPAGARLRHPLDVEVRFAARRLRGAALPSLQSATVEASLVDGWLKVSRFDVGVAQGRVAGKASLELAARPMHGDAEIDVTAIRVESLLGADAANRQLSGVLHGRAALQATGESLDALLASAVGTVSGFVSAGTISSLLDAKMGLQGGRVVRSMLTGAEPIALRCAAAVLELRNGEGRIRTLVVDTERTRTTGTGTIDLARQTLDVVLTPQAKQPGLFVLDRSIHLQGALREPRHELVARAAPSAAAASGCRPERS